MNDPETPTPKTENPLAEWVEACRDLGLTEIYFPVRSSASSTISTATTGASESNGERAAALARLQTSEIGNCTRCKLFRQRKTIVFGEGNAHAELMLIGEAPGADEDEQGRPFIGRAGQLLMQMIRAIEFERNDVYIANVIKCRPPLNRPPEQDEIEQCSPFLMKQIEIIQPKIILALGTFAAQLLLQSKTSITYLRSKVYDMPFGRVIATYHPSFLLRSPNKKPEAWEDLKLVRRTLQEG